VDKLKPVPIKAEEMIAPMFIVKKKGSANSIVNWQPNEQSQCWLHLALALSSLENPFISALRQKFKNLAGNMQNFSPVATKLRS